MRKTHFNGLPNSSAKRSVLLGTQGSYPMSYFLKGLPSGVTFETTFTLDMLNDRNNSFSPQSDPL